MASVGGAVNAGVFLAFSAFIMPAVEDLPAAQGIQAMQALNRTAVAPFMLVGFGTATLCLVVMMRGFRARGTARSRLMVGGAVSYLIAAIMITFAANVPISAAIDSLDPSSAEAHREWADLYAQWIWWNHVRALGSVGAAAALTIALCSSGPSSRRPAEGVGDTDPGSI